MNYASLDEIYDTKTLQVRKNNYNEVMKNLTQKNKRDQQMASEHIGEPRAASRSKYTTYSKVENFTNEEPNYTSELDQLTKSIDTKYNKQSDTIRVKPDEESECIRFLDHISKCEKCRNFIIKKFNIQPENPEQKNREEMLDIAIYILTGVFVLFLLDSFMNLGKYLKRQ